MVVQPTEKRPEHSGRHARISAAIDSCEGFFDFVDHADTGATRHDRLSLLQSLVDSSAKIAKGFEAVTLVMSNGQVYGGVIRSEVDGEIVLEKPDGMKVTLKVADVEERSQPKSAMPEMNRNLSARELRDLVEFLANLK